MLIRCKNCEKLFDYEACNGICPDCGLYHDAPSEIPHPASTRVKTPRGGLRPGETLSPQAQRLRTASIVLVVIMVIVMVSCLVFLRIRENAWKRSGQYEDVKVSTVNYQEFSLRGRRVKFGPCEVMGPAYDTDDLPKNEQLVRVHMDLADSDEYLTGLEDELFLRADGPGGTSYLRPLSDYRIEEYLPDLYDAYLLGTYEISSSSEHSGWLYFTMPRNTETAWIHIDLGQDMHSNVGWNRAPDGAYLAQLPIVPAQTGEPAEPQADASAGSEAPAESEVTDHD